MKMYRLITSILVVIVFSLTKLLAQADKQIITVVDVDGNVYKTAIIGTQVWMAENLKTTKYSNGDSIGTTYPDTLNYMRESNPKYQWIYANKDSNLYSYGRLYTWFVANDNRNVCPTGWHVPTQVDWVTLIKFLGGDSLAHGKLKEIGTKHWNKPNIGATNESGFTGIPGGNHHYFIGV